MAMLVGIIFGPVAANIFNPYTWGNTDYITLEVARIVIVVQVFAVGVELPKKYLKKHWKSVAIMLLPVMMSSWFICAAIIYGLIPKLNFVESLVIAATLAPTDPVLASSVVGKGKFAERVPGHIRNLLSCESGCNDGMAFPFLYLGLYTILDIEVNKTAKDWILITILYECLFGIVLGILIGYGARFAIRYAEDRKLIDRESFLVFYFVLALFCTGLGTVVGVDDFLVAFSAGAAFAWDGWFSKKTEESHVSNVIDLLLNMAFFVYFGAIIPWSDFNSPDLGITPWRLVVIAVLVLLFRRIPSVFAVYKVCPDIRTWREALFCGHFGPIGVGALFFTILARAELETESQVPAGRLPGVEEEHGYLIGAIYPIVNFVVLASIIVHGSSVAVFTLGKHVQTNVLPSISMTFTRNRDSEEVSPNWLQRLPRLEIGQSMTFSKSRDRSRSRETAGGHIDRTAIGSAIDPKDVRSQKRNERRGRSARRNDHPEHTRHSSPGLPSPEGLPDTATMEDERDEDEIEAARQHHEEVAPAMASYDAHFHEDGQQVFHEGNQFIVEDELGEVIRVVSNPAKLSNSAAHNLLDKDSDLDDVSREKREEIARNPHHPLFPKQKSFIHGLRKTQERNVGLQQEHSHADKSKDSDDMTLASAARTPQPKAVSNSNNSDEELFEKVSTNTPQSTRSLSNRIEELETTPERRRRLHALLSSGADNARHVQLQRPEISRQDDEGETPAEKKRRLQALGHSVEPGLGDKSKASGNDSQSSANQTQDTNQRQPTISFHSSVGEPLMSRGRSPQTIQDAPAASSNSLEVSGVPLSQSHSRGRSIVWADRKPAT